MRPTRPAKRPHKYYLYEQSVQTPDIHAEMFQLFYRDLNKGRFATHLREDFCGTFQLSHSWVKRNRANTALGLDLDPEPIAYGRKHHASNLTREQKSRLQIKLKDVRSVTRPKVDVVVACNFSFCIFQMRAELLKYFKAVRKSLRPGGILFLELAGGPGMIQTMRERKRVPMSEKKGAPRFIYTWHQKSFDPVNNRGLYAIHFDLPDGQKLKDAFTYDWRLWSIPELREIMQEAGFDSSHVYWETSHKGKGTGEYARTEKADNDFSWITYVVGHVR